LGSIKAFAGSAGYFLRQSPNICAMVSYHNVISRAGKKRKYGTGGRPADTAIGAVKKKRVGVKGGRTKLKLTSAKVINVIAAGKPIACEIVSVRENAANKDYVRRNVITKGAVLLVKGPDGSELSVRVTSKPGQHGVLNGIVI
jgi:small subunit ribosomal protein S8e